MNEAQFQALVGLVRYMAESMTEENEPWHIALTALTGVYQDITYAELVASVKAVAVQFGKEAALVGKVFGLKQAEDDALQLTVIAYCMETALVVAGAKETLALPEGSAA